jgi:hypothetical protein
MSFLTSEEAGLGQPWYDESNVVAGMGGLLSMQELTSLKNYYQDPPMFPASAGLAFNELGGLGIPASDLRPGEFMTGQTLVDTTSVGNVHARRNRPWRGSGARRAARRRAREQGICTTEMAAARISRRNLRSCLDQAGVGSSSTRASVRASEGAVLSGMGAAGGGSIPISDLVHGEYETAGQMIRRPQAFGGMGAGTPVPRRDFIPGEIVSAGTLVDHAQGFGSRAVPISDLVPGEYARPSTLVDHAQGFGGLGAGAAVPRRDFVPGEIVSARHLAARPESFSLGMGSSLRLPNGQPGRYHGQYGVPISDLKKGEYERAAQMLSAPQSFGDWIPFKPGAPEPKSGTQGTWLSPDQVPAWDREKASTLVSQPQNFGGLGAGSPVPRGDFVEGEIESAARMLSHGQAFGGLGAGAPVPRGDFVHGEITPASSLTAHSQNFGAMGDAAQGTWLAPSQVAKSQRGTDASLVDHPQSFSLGGLGASGDNVRVGQLNLAPICDPQTGACISYATPASIKAAIGAQVGGQSALTQGHAQLPAFYQHPNLGPWGVDPKQAYQYWWAQQAAMQRAGNMAPIPIWGSPGFVHPTPPLPASPIAQEAAFNPYTEAFPVAGTAVERF